jgi:hypothetical protein
MKTIESYKEEIPDYAMSYLHNNDASGLDDSDITSIDAFMQWYYDRALEVGGHVIIGYNSDDEGSFTHKPAFGLACTCVATEILICK